MIVGFLLTILLTFLNVILGLLPVATLDSAISTALTNFINYVYQFNAYFPIDTAIQLVKYSVAFWILVFSFDFFL